MEISESLRDCIAKLVAGGFVLIHDSDSRENETDMMLAAERATPERIRKMRVEAGGLICVALSAQIAKQLGLPYLGEALKHARSRYPILPRLVGNYPEGSERPALSLTINHKTFSGVTDRDRSYTISELAKFAASALRGDERTIKEFPSKFRVPGHVQLLIASKGLHERQGHTELSVYLAELAGLTPATIICEMLDNEGYGALAPHEARVFANAHDIPFIEASELMAHYEATSLKGKVRNARRLTADNIRKPKTRSRR